MCKISTKICDDRKEVYCSRQWRGEFPCKWNIMNEVWESTSISKNQPNSGRICGNNNYELQLKQKAYHSIYSRWHLKLLSFPQACSWPAYTVRLCFSVLGGLCYLPNTLKLYWKKHVVVCNYNLLYYFLRYSQMWEITLHDPKEREIT